MAKTKTSKPTQKSAPKSAPAGRVVPLGDRVLLREIERADSKTASGIIIPENADSDRDTKKGIVVAVGEGKFVDGKREPMSVAVGQTVLYSWGDVVTVDGTKYTLVRDSEIAAILR